jgi:hypothetical protein
MAKVEIAAIGGQRPFVLEALRSEFVLHEVWDAPDKVAALGPAAERIRGVVSHGMAGLPTAVIEALPNLEICAINGVGLETTDLETARRRGVVVATAPVLFDDVADLAVALGWPPAGGWPRATGSCARALAPGPDADGPEVLGQARRHPGLRPDRRHAGPAAGRVRHGDRLPRPMPKPGVAHTAWPDPVTLARNSDILFMCAAGLPGSGRVVTREILEALGPEGVFVNVSRGWLVDEPALVELLGSGGLGPPASTCSRTSPGCPRPCSASTTSSSPRTSPATRRRRCGRWASACWGTSAPGSRARAP